VLSCTTLGVFPIPLFADCDGELANGCEADLSDDQNCGMCGRVCTCDGLRCATDNTGSGGPGSGNPN